MNWCERKVRTLAISEHTAPRSPMRVHGWNELQVHESAILKRLAFDRRIMAWHRSNETSKRLDDAKHRSVKVASQGSSPIADYAETYLSRFL